eukprot:TRINITY_DN37281_c0_g1_i1.p1 TRINITY_DN37281_c0_g1~~TRINITY_DN37281_c0_g1_i1.p1  ORF type:complete len:489 (+),score=98.74 TRINITY_DN37281_c0_g1_i1:132-1598(+)
MCIRDSNQTGENNDEDDENLTFEMSKVPNDVSFIMVCVTSYTGVDFTVVEKATCRLLNKNTRQVVHEFGLGVVGNHTASLLCAFSRTQVPNGDTMETFWAMREINIPCNGYTFADVLPKMLDLLAVQESDKEASLLGLPDYSLVKDALSSNINPAQLKMGLGWDDENDLDAALVMLSEDNTYIDHVHAKHGKLRSKDGAVVHSGDKLNGYDVQGDDEYLTVDLNKVDKRVSKIVFLVLLFDGSSKTLSSVPQGYVRMQNKAPNETQYRELDRFDLTKSKGDSTAFMFSMVHREGSSVWTYTSINDGILEGRDWVDVYPHVRCFTKCFTTGGIESWAPWKADAEKPFYVEVFFKEARNLGPLEPHHFSCHCEAWVCDKKGVGRYKTAPCGNRNEMSWSGESAVFKVSMLDRIRVMLYEHSLVGTVDIDFSELPRLATIGAELDAWFPLIGHQITGELQLGIVCLSPEEASSRLQAVAAPQAQERWCAIM